MWIGHCRYEEWLRHLIILSIANYLVGLSGFVSKGCTRRMGRRVRTSQDVGEVRGSSYTELRTPETCLRNKERRGTTA